MRKPVLRISKVRPVNGPSSFVEAFQKELRTLDIEDIMEPDVTTEFMLQKMQAMLPHSIVLKQDTGGHKSFLFVEADIIFGGHILMRKDHLLASGTLVSMKEEFLSKIQGEYPGKFDRILATEVDNVWIENFCQMHYNNPKLFRIINVE